MILILIPSIFAFFTQTLFVPLQKPVIGVYTQDSSYHPDNPNSTYIAASYIKWLQSSGAQVVPVFSYSTEAELLYIFTKINGLVFPGGDMEININNTWTKNADFLVKKAIQENKKGETFPIYATCLGFQLLSYLFNNYSASTLSSVGGQSAIVRPLSFLSESYIFSNLDDKVKREVSGNSGIYYFNHRFCVSRKTFQASQGLTQNFKLVSTSSNLSGFQFVSFIQGKTIPFFGSQFHPQKNSFQWKVDANRTWTGIKAQFHIANQFVQTSRRSTHSFNSIDQLESLSIQNYKKEVIEKGCSFSQVISFNEKRRP